MVQDLGYMVGIITGTAARGEHRRLGCTHASRGLLLGVANPKAWLAIAATFASARLATTATTDAVAKIAVLSMMVVLIMAAWLIAGTFLAAVLRDAKRARMVSVVFAVTLVVATASTVFRL